MSRQTVKKLERKLSKKKKPKKGKLRQRNILKKDAIKVPVKNNV